MSYTYNDAALSTVTGAFNSDDYFGLDGATAGPRKVRCSRVVLNDQSYADPAWITSLSSSKITGLGSIATQPASSVSITGGSVSGLSSLGVTGTATVGGNLNLTGITTGGGAMVTTASALGLGLAIDVTKALNTKSLNSDSPFTFTGTPSTDQWWSLLVTNTDTVSHTLTIPTSYSIAAAANITTVTIPASGRLHLTWYYTGTGYLIYGDPVTGGGGGVTTVSVVSANGISGTVANASSTPAITLSLGAITPTSVNGVVFSGASSPALTVTGSASVAGTNSGDQTITLTGDVTGSGTGSFAATIANGAVTNAKLAYSSITVGGTAVSLGGTVTSLTGLTSISADTLNVSTLNLSNPLTVDTLNATTINLASPFNISTATTGNLPVSRLNSGTGASASTFWRGDGTWAAVSSSGGSVTTVSVVTANGVSGTVANATSTPAITLTLGAITPTSVAATGTVTGTNLNGTNTGDQTITLTGDVTGSGTGSFAATIGNGVVTNAKLANSSVTIGTTTVSLGGTVTSLAGLTSLAIDTLSATTLNLSTPLNINAATTGNLPVSRLNSGTGASATTFWRGDGTWATPASSGGSVTSVSVVSANGISGTVATATTTPAITLTLGAITPSSVAATGTVTGSNLSGTNTGDQTITLTGNVTGSGTGSFATTIANAAVTNAMLANVATATFKGRTAAGTGSPEDLTGTQATALLDTFTSALKGLAPASGGGTANYLRADGTWATPPNSGGTVTTISVVSANGVSGSVANASATPAITLTLGAITPTTVNGITLSGSSTPTLSVTGTSSISGAHSGTSSGTNTGDQTISLTGDVTGSGTGSFAATIAAGAVTNAKLQNSSVTIGSSTVSLGGTASSISGLTSLSTGSLTATGITTTGGATVTTASAMGALAIDVTKSLNTKTISADSGPYTFSGTPSTDQWWSLLVTNSDTASHTLTIPSSYSIAAAATITTVTVPASGRVHLTWYYTGSGYVVYGDPVAGGSGSLTLTGDVTGSGTGSFATTISAGAVTNAKLANSSVTIGSTAVSLGSSATSLAGLTTLTFGTPAFSDTGLVLQGTGNTNSYYQVELINTNTGTTASTDVSLHRDGATASTNFVDLGINSSGYSGSGSLNRASAGYLYASDDELVVGTAANKAFTVVTQGSDRITVTGAGVTTLSGQTNLTNSTASTTSNNGALVVSGGVGIAGNTNIGGFISFQSGTSNKKNTFSNNFNTSAQTLTAATRTYVAGSNIDFPAGAIVAGTVFRWRLALSKTAAGTATSTIEIVFGTTATTADTARVTFTKIAGTAAVDEAGVEITCIVRSAGSGTSAVVNGSFHLGHNSNNAGFINTSNVCYNVTSAGFDSSTVTDVGICYTSGASEVVTVQQVIATAINL